MSSATVIANYILSSLTVIGQVGIIVLLGALLLKKTRHPIIQFFSSRAPHFSFIVALVAMLGSLFYSEIAGFEPCKLCWYQRILMYPEAILFGLALWKKETRIGEYLVWLSGLGALIAGYHYLLQRGIAPALPCSAVGYSVSCSKLFVMNFGYITIPLMAFTAFALITLLYFVQKKNNSV